jgi:hypothetical protein
MMVLTIVSTLVTKTKLALALAHVCRDVRPNIKLPCVFKVRRKWVYRYRCWAGIEKRWG